MVICSSIQYVRKLPTMILMRKRSFANERVEAEKGSTDNIVREKKKTNETNNVRFSFEHTEKPRIHDAYPGEMLSNSYRGRFRYHRFSPCYD